MSLLEEIQSRRPSKLCRFGAWLVAASKQDRADLAAAFADPTIRGKWIADVLASRGAGAVVDSVNDHRRGACSVCPSNAEMLNVPA